MRRERSCATYAGPVSIANKRTVMFARRQKIVGTQTSGHWTGSSRFRRHVQILLRTRFGRAQRLARSRWTPMDITSHRWRYCHSVSDARLRLNLLDTAGNAEMRQHGRLQRRSQSTALHGRNPGRVLRRHIFACYILYRFQIVVRARCG